MKISHAKKLEGKTIRVAVKPTCTPSSATPDKPPC